MDEAIPNQNLVIADGTYSDLNVFTRQCPQDGRFLGWRWYVDEPAHDPTHSLRLQLWRPIVNGAHTPMYMLVYESDYKVDNYFNSPQEFYVEDDLILELQDGDVIGWGLIGKAYIRDSALPTEGGDVRCDQTAIQSIEQCLYRNTVSRLRFQGIYQHRKIWIIILSRLSHHCHVGLEFVIFKITFSMLCMFQANPHKPLTVETNYAILKSFLAWIFHAVH